MIRDKSKINLVTVITEEPIRVNNVTAGTIFYCCTERTFFIISWKNKDTCEIWDATFALKTTLIMIWEGIKFGFPEYWTLRSINFVNQFDVELENWND